jgi:Zn-dependent protease/predicted transcriptional regulator
MKSALSLGKVSGIRVSIHWTFLLLIAWIVIQNLRAGVATGPLLWTLLFVGAIFVCVVLHELGHALAAQRYGIRTRDITLYPIGGVARLESIPHKPKEELVVALAGPLVNLVIAALIMPWTAAPLLSGTETEIQIGPGNFLFAFAVVNAWLAIFNLVPAFPMDGGRVFRALLSFWMERARATRVAATFGQVIAVGFIFLGFYVNPFLIFIGLFIILGAQAEANYASTEALMEGHTVLDLTMREMPVVKPEATVGEMVREILNTQKKNFVVADESRVLGVISQLDVIKALGDKGDQLLVRDCMQTNILYLPSNLPVNDAIVKMQSAGRTIALVKEGDAVIGMVDNDNLVEFVLIQRARQHQTSSS